MEEPFAHLGAPPGRRGVPAVREAGGPRVSRGGAESELIAASTAAFWLGTLAAISPCPLATNVAAISYIGKDLESAPRVLASGLLYALGRMLAYVGVAALVVSSLLSIPAVASFLQDGMNRVLGPLLIVVGAFVLGWIPMPKLDWGRRGQALKERAARGGLVGAGLLTRPLARL